MEHKTYTFTTQATQLYYDAAFNDLQEIVGKARAIIITDKHLESIYPEKFSGWQTIAIEPGENNKQQFTVDRIIDKLISLEAERSTILIGVGGGVVTDITGYVASVYMRGINFGFVPTSILGVVDASIGGKNGIDTGNVKNVVGTTRQPSFILHDHAFFAGLPFAEWINGFAEIIKHACINDPALFALLEENELPGFMNSTGLLADLIRKNVEIKTAIVIRDEYEKHERRLLNFGHTFGHAIETTLNIPHGHAVSMGIVMACKLSEKYLGLDPVVTSRITRLLEKYHLPVSADFNKEEVFDLIKHDKKRDGERINFILLKSIGQAVVHPLTFEEIKQL